MRLKLDSKLFQLADGVDNAFSDGMKPELTLIIPDMMSSGCSPNLAVEWHQLIMVEDYRFVDDVEIVDDVGIF